MSDDEKSNRLLEAAYAVETPQDSREYYADFAEVYDSDFAAALGYLYPRIIADALGRLGGPDDTPVADIGCGTGLVAEAISAPRLIIDGFDISPDMLAKARDKAIYRNLVEIDLTQPIAHPTRYGAIISAGTFTHGHLGPAPLANILTLAQPDALFVIGVNAQHFETKGFAAVLDQLMHEGRIRDLSRERTELYSRKDTPHGADEAQIVCFRAT